MANRAGICLLALAAPLWTQPLKLDTGRQIYQAACVACHGPDGKGQPPSVLGFERPETFPDFTDCAQTTPEDNLSWTSIIHEGGPSRGFSEIMPSFTEALTPEQIGKVIAHLRGFCKDDRWPRGELNLPRALITEKAFPENETVITSGVNVRGTPGVSNQVVYERRISVRNQLEISVPLDFQRPSRGVWYGGVGDIGIGLKRALFSNLPRGSILSLQGEVILPAGNRAHGLGGGTAVFESFASYGQLLPWNGFLQAQGGAELPADTAKVPQAVYFRTALGKAFNQNHGLGRLWAPMVEWVGDRELTTGAAINWDVIPQFQVTLSRRQHVRANLGVRIPATNTAGRPVQLMFYLLWDRQDGGVLEGW